MSSGGVSDTPALHDQLLARTEQPLAGEQYSVAFLAAPMNALRAVVELHAPDALTLETWCKECGHLAWPCNTIKTIASALSVESP